MGESSRADALGRDAADPLAPFIDRFVVADPDRIYLDGNSLGRLAVDVRDAALRAVDDWGERVVEGWHDWIELPALVGDRLARVALGARPGEVLVADSVTVNLYKLAHAAADLRPGPIVTDAGNFPTDRYVLEGVARQRGRRYVEATSIGAAVDAAPNGVLCLSHVDYRTGALLPMAELTAATDALVIWDLSHSAGAVEIDLATAQLAVGCTYKYLNAGPGAPAFAYVRADLQPELRSPIQGWFGQRDQFVMGPGYEPAEGIGRLAAGTPSILGIRCLDAALGLVEEAGMDRIAAKGRALTSLAIRLADAWLVAHDAEVATPRDPAARGNHLAVRHGDAWRIARTLIEQERVVPDFRQPDIVRLGLSPLTTTFAATWDAMDRFRRVLETRSYRSVDATPGRVT